MKFKSLKYAAIGACAVGSLAATDAIAQSQQITGATVTAVVQNAFTLVETTAMHFGTMAVLCDTAAANSATIVLDPTTSAGVITNAAPAQIVDIDIAARTRAVIDVTNAAPTTALTIATANAAPLTCTTGCTGGNPTIALSALTDSAGGTATTDGAGAVQFGIGATLTTTGTCAQQYEDGTYVGTYDITVSY